MCWDSADGVARCYRADVDRWEKFPVPEGFGRNTLFLDEMRHLLACLDGSERPRCTLGDGTQALRIALAAKESALVGRTVSL